MKRILQVFLAFVLMLKGFDAQAQCLSTVIASNNSTSGNFRGLNPNFGRGTSVFLITASEMAAAGFTSGNVLSQIGGAFNTAPNITTTGNLQIWFENTADVTNTKSTTWATAISTMTVAHNATFTIPNATTWGLTLGTPFNYTGGGIYIAYEWTNCGTLATGSVVSCNNTAGPGVKSAQSTACTAITTVSANSTFRPTTLLAASGTPTNIALISAWPHGKIPAGAGAPETIPFTVRSNYGTPQTTNANLLIKEQISGTVRYTQTIPITIPSCGDLTSEFTGWMPSIQETDSVIVTIDPVAGESNLLDNASRKIEIVGNNAYTHNLNGFAGATLAVGFNTNSGLMLARHSVNGCISATAVKARLSVPVASAGNTVYGVIVSPTGAILGQSPNYVTAAADSNTVVTFTFPAPVALSNTDFYIGLAQTANVVGYFPLMTESENLTRPNTFYSTGLAGGALSAPITNLGRLNLEVDIATSPAVYASIASQALGYCPGTSFNVNYVVNNTTLIAGNTLNVELSDASGNFTTPTVIGTLSTTASTGTISATLPPATAGGSGYRIRIVASNPSITGCANNTDINVYSAPTFSSVAGTNVSCNGGSNGTITANSMAILPTYTLNVPATQNIPGTFTGLSANTYTVTLTDGNTCTATSSITLTQPSVVVPSIAATTLCAGGSATLTASATGGTPGYTYFWLTGGSSLNPLTINTAATYTVEVTDANGCTGTTTVAVTVTPLPTVTASSTPSPATVCAGGSVTLTGGGATSYTWTDGTNTPTNGVSFVPTASSTYTVTGTTSGCSSVATVSVSVLSGTAPSTVMGDTICGPGVVNLSATAAPGDTLLWYTVPTGGTSVGQGASFNPSISADVTYYVEGNAFLASTTTSYYTGMITNAGGGGQQSSTNYNIFDVLAPSITLDSVTIYPGNTGPQTVNIQLANSSFTVLQTISVAINPTVAGAPLQIPVGMVIPAGTGYQLGQSSSSINLWRNNGGVTYPYTVPGVISITNSAAGTSFYYFFYNWKVTTGSTSYCPSATRTPVLAKVNPLPIVTGLATPSSVCLGGSTTFTGSGASTYTWTNGSNTPTDAVAFTPTSVGASTYTVTGTDANLCTAISTVTLTVNAVPATPSPTATPSSMCEGATASLSTPLPPSTGPSLDPGAICNPTYSSGNTFGDYINNVTFGAINNTTGVNAIPSNTFYSSPVVIVNKGMSYPLSVQVGTYTANDVAVWVDFNRDGDFDDLGEKIGELDNNGASAVVPFSIAIPLSAQLGYTRMRIVEADQGTSGGMLPCTGYQYGESEDYQIDIQDPSLTIAWTGPANIASATSATTNVTPASTGALTYTVTITDANGCTSSSSTPLTVNANPSVTASATPSTTCNNSSVTPMGGGASTYTWSGGLTDNTPYVATTGTTTYTVTGTDGAGCTATSSVTVTVNASSGNLASATSNQGQNQADDFNLSYYDLSCNLIATVDDGAGGNILGLTTATVNVDANAGVHNGQPFVRRWYQITPANNVGVSATVTLYIDQSDFANYNSTVVAPYLPMPTSGNNADPNIANIRITKNTDAGLGNTPEVITPTVNWNGNYWELTFPVTGFSQFRVHSANPGNIPLPATITKFSGRKLNSSDMLEWTTASEQNSAYFNLQHSTNGVDFKTIAKVNSKAPNGNSQTDLNYGFEHTTPSLGHNYYRLVQVDVDNQSSIHAKIVDLIWGANGSTVSLYPNPTQDVLNIDLYTTKVQNTTVKVMDMSGRVVKQIQARSEAGMNTLSISLLELASGVYTVQVFDNDKLSHTSKVKKN